MHCLILKIWLDLPTLRFQNLDCFPRSSYCSVTHTHSLSHSCGTHTHIHRIFLAHVALSLSLTHTHTSSHSWLTQRHKRYSPYQQSSHRNCPGCQAPCNPESGPVEQKSAQLRSCHKLVPQCSSPPGSCDSAGSNSCSIRVTT